MKHLEYTRKYLLEDLGCEQFKYAGEYLFIGDAEIYIDRGDDDIILFHDGSQFIRFVMSQRDITVYYKGRLDMLRLSGKTEFDIKIISERFNLDNSTIEGILAEMLGKMETIRRENEICCKTLNANLNKLAEKLKNVEKSKNSKEMEKKLDEILKEVKAARAESAACCKKTNDKLDAFGERLGKIEAKVGRNLDDFKPLDPKDEGKGTDTPETKGGDTDTGVYPGAEMNPGLDNNPTVDEGEGTTTPSGSLPKTPIEIGGDTGSSIGKTPKTEPGGGDKGDKGDNTKDPGAEPKVGMMGEGGTTETDPEPTPKTEDFAPIILAIKNGKFVATVPEEYKKDEEFCILVQDLSGTYWETTMSYYGSLDEALAVTPEIGKTYKLGYKIDESVGFSYDGEGFKHFSEPVTFATAAPVDTGECKPMKLSIDFDNNQIIPDVPEEYRNNIILFSRRMSGGDWVAVNKLPTTLDAVVQQVSYHGLDFGAIYVLGYGLKTQTDSPVPSDMKCLSNEVVFTK